jgi:hypothetical protein
MQVREPDGPLTDLSYLDPSLKNYPFLMEYSVNPPCYTQNGYEFAIIGLYDWAELAHSKKARELFNAHLKTLKKLLPYYDMGTYSAYDLSYITHASPIYLVERPPHFGPRYHKIHIEMMEALYSIDKDPLFKTMAERWRSYVE